jgi:hypothetical protein
MRTITADWSVSAHEREKSGKRLSILGAKRGKFPSPRQAGRQAKKAGSALSSRGRDYPVPADVAAFISAFMRIG